MPIYLKTVLKIIFALFLAFFALKLLHYHVSLINFPYSATLREGAMMTSTDALVHGLDPYDMSLQPNFMNPYGIIYPLLVWPLAKIFGTTLLVHRIVSAFSIIACCILVFLVLRKMSVPLLLNLWAILMLYASWLYQGTSTPSVDPGGTAMLFLLLTVFTPCFLRYSYKSLLLSALFAILAFYTKPYGVLGAPIICSYLFLFVSKKKSLAYGCLLLAFMTISVLFINQIFPAYFDNCFFTSLNMTHAWSRLDHLYFQIDLYSKIYAWTLILLGIFIAWQGFKIYKTKDFTILKNDDIRLVSWAILWACFVLYTSLGRHTGATLWYFFQLLSPFLLIAAAWVFSQNLLIDMIGVPFLIINLFTITSKLDYTLFNKNEPNWLAASTLLSQYPHVLASPILVPLLVEENKQVYDNGQTEYFLSGADRPSWMQGFLKTDYRGYIQMAKFFRDIEHKVENKDFEIILLPPSLLPLGIDEAIHKNYKMVGNLVVLAPQDVRPYDITVWVPQ